MNEKKSNAGHMGSISAPTSRIVFAVMLLLPMSAVAQTPQPLRAGVPVDAVLQATPENADARDCYIIDTAPGMILNITLEAATFSPELTVSRGALCTVTTPIYRAVAKPGEPAARIAFKSPGGRYLVFVGQGQGGTHKPYRLTALSGQDSPPQGPQSPVPSPLVLAEGSTEGARIALMRRQRQEREALLQREREMRERQEREDRLASQRAEQEEAEWRREQQAQEAQSAAIVGRAITGAVRGVAETYIQTQAETAEMEARIAADQARARREAQDRRAKEAADRERQAIVTKNELARRQAEADRQRAEAASQAAEQLQGQAQIRQQEAQRQVAALVGPTKSSGGAGTSSVSVDQGEQITVLEGLVVCPGGYVGQVTCFGPRTSGKSDIDSPREISFICEGSNVAVSVDYGMHGRYRVWGCGFGLNPQRTSQPIIDQAARVGITVPSRRTFNCPATIQSYCTD